MMAIAVFDEDYRKAMELLARASFASLQDQVARAIVEERERCAQVAENFNAAGKPIAAAIRQS